MIKNIRDLFGQEKNYYKVVSVSNFWSIKYIEYESNGDRNKTLSTEDILIKLVHI